MRRTVDNAPFDAYAFFMKSTNPILYAGDTSLRTAGTYLAGILAHAGLAFEYLPSDQPIAPALRCGSRPLYIISDYPVKNWTDPDFQAVAAAVSDGAGLLMIGGWESFHGLEGEYHNSPLAEILPVTMEDHDDRVQSRRPWLIQAVESHPILKGLPFQTPPTVGGFNRISPKPGATELLRATAMEISDSPEEGLQMTSGASESLLVIGTFGKGRTAALACDVAPHWVGTLVDWGQPRVQAQAPNAEAVEVGCHYAEFFTRLVKWTMGEI
ncbi:MAG: hypothetical protein JW849_09130 [Phycisphaerae bacterium]|nr:hypothetical protein [Phycisphaerae bacterium]